MNTPQSNNSPATLPLGLPPLSDAPLAPEYKRMFDLLGRCRQELGVAPPPMRNQTPEQRSQMMEAALAKGEAPEMWKTWKPGLSSGDFAQLSATSLRRD